METDKKLKILQLFYAGVLADAIANYEKFGILDKVTAKKAAEQKMMAKGQLAQLAIKDPDELFAKFSEIFGCIDWKVEHKADKIRATGNNCLLCAMAKRMGTAQPCKIFCINPFAGLASSLEPGWDLNVAKTLWESDQCEFNLEKMI